jgi:hypothetical protein
MSLLKGSRVEGVKGENIIDRPIVLGDAETTTQAISFSPALNLTPHSSLAPATHSHHQQS